MLVFWLPLLATFERGHSARLHRSWAWYMTTIQSIIYCHVTSTPTLSGGFWVGGCKSVLCAGKYHLHRPEQVALSSDASKGLFVNEQVVASKCGQRHENKECYWVWTLISQVCQKANSNVVIWAYINSGMSDKLITLLTKADWGRQESKDMAVYFMSRIGKREKTVNKTTNLLLTTVSEVRNEGLLKTHAIRLNKLQKKYPLSVCPKKQEKLNFP